MTNPETDRLKRETIADLKAGQIDWLLQSGIDRERPDYTLKIEGNLFEPLSNDCLQELGGGQGAELKRRNYGASPPKFHAVHSSSVLVANVFEHWRHRDMSVVSRAVDSPVPLTRMQVEAKYATGYGFPCNLDVALTADRNEYVIAVESKFTEPFGKPKAGLKIAYVPVEGDSAWMKLGLEKCDRIARQIQAQPESYEYLDVPQLLKHILGLHRKLKNQFRLLYLFYDVPTPAGDAHRNDIDRFTTALDGEIDFRSMSYQKLVQDLKRLAPESDHREYFAYLKRRYQLG